MEDDKEGRIKKRFKKWDHIPVRPSTFETFRILRDSNHKSDNSFVKELLRVYTLYLQVKKRRAQEETNKLE